MMADQSALSRCWQALDEAGCRVDFEKTVVRVRFPPDPNDPHAAPDGDEVEYDRKHFVNTALLVYARLVAEGAIKEGGD